MKFSPPIPGGVYRYTQDLLALEANPTSPLLKVIWGRTHPAADVGTYLAQHPDQEYANFFKRGIQGGFKVVFDRCHPFRPHKRNNESAFKNQAAAQSYIAEEKALGTSCISHKTLQLIGVLSDLPDKFCLIIDLSSPSGASVNNGIDSELMSSTYSSAANWDLPGLVSLEMRLPGKKLECLKHAPRKWLAQSSATKWASFLTQQGSSAQGGHFSASY